ncbi:response regulator transcription factor [Streptococcus loxodontisalivarius]|uniref:DNA-binding NarL/FixJ family response regulator n=1 Tax=Streptococcus loxodontisalivarius TaxID=1349415 RepID=A0ABS2PVM5_9STRE|nr:response regulator transcription factor [Streptococcus loxodontisalivarius]MBM7643765.1 DNA-binding NarL/FixJ family response regulator [Streptococcus loxodontisalivarius]
MIKVLIADDQELIRESIRIVLSSYPDIEVVATASNGLEVLECLKDCPVDLILMDIRMPEMDGVVCTKAVKALSPETKVIILTTFDDDEFIFSALEYGASGYILKGISMEDLHQAIITVNAGNAMLNPDIAAKVFRLFSQVSHAQSSIEVDLSGVEQLSQTDWRVIQEVGHGLSNKEISSKLFLSEGTVRNYLSLILSKLQLRDRTQLAIWAVQTGVLTRNYDEKKETI